MSELQDLKQQMADKIFGQQTEYERNYCCINCKKEIYRTSTPDNKPGNIYSDAGEDEWKISGLCEYCFDKITAE